MQRKKGSRLSRDPYQYWKVVNMTLAFLIVVLALLILLGDLKWLLVPVEFFLGAVMCSCSGIMELVKGKKAVGYTCSVFAGIMLVALIVTVIRMEFF